MNSYSRIHRRGLPALFLAAPALAQGRLPAIVTTTAMLADAVRALAAASPKLRLRRAFDPRLIVSDPAALADYEKRVEAEFARSVRQNTL